MTFNVGDKVTSSGELTSEEFREFTFGLNADDVHTIVYIEHDGDPDADDDTLIKLEGMPANVALGPGVLKRV